MAAGFICGISIAVYGKPWTLWLLFFGILLWPAIVTGHDRGMPESDRYPVRKRRWCMAVCSVAALFLGWHHCGVVQAEQNQYLPYLEDGEEILLKGKVTGKEQKNEQYLYNLSSCQIRQDSKSVNGSAYLQASSSMVSPTPVLSDKRLFYMEK